MRFYVIKYGNLYEDFRKPGVKTRFYKQARRFSEFWQAMKYVREHQIWNCRIEPMQF